MCVRVRARVCEGGRISAGGGEAWTLICNYTCAQTNTMQKTYIYTCTCVHTHPHTDTHTSHRCTHVHAHRYWIGPDAAWNCFDFSVVAVGLATQFFPAAFGSFSGVSVALTKLKSKLTHETINPLYTTRVRGGTARTSVSWSVGTIASQINKTTTTPPTSGRWCCAYCACFVSFHCFSRAKI